MKKGLEAQAAYSWNIHPLDSAISEVVVGRTSDGVVVRIVGMTSGPWNARADVMLASMMTKVMINKQIKKVKPASKPRQLEFDFKPENKPIQIDISLPPELTNLLKEGQ